MAAPGPKARWYAENKVRHIAAVRDRKLRLRFFLTVYKDQPCAECRKSFPPVAMDFDHRPGERKLFVIAHGPKSGFSVQKILAEIAKCDVVCSNCHRIRTARRQVRAL